MSAINYDRGLLKRKHPVAGLDVYMYVDEPGVFRNAHGAEVDPELAAQAGFDTETLLKERRRRERVSEAEAAINAEFMQPVALKVVGQINGYKIVRLNGNNHQIMDADGNVLTPGKLLTKDQAIQVAKLMSPIEKAKEVEEVAEEAGEQE